MRYVVTGGAGFIGSHIARALSGDHDVVILDDFSAGSRSRIADLPVECVAGSVTDPDLLGEVFASADGVFHQAAIVSVPRSVADPRRSHDVNLTGTLNVLLAARDAGVRRVVLASSAAVYGDCPRLPLRESECPQPLSPYALQKSAGEAYAALVSSPGTVSLRYFNVYGPGQDPASPYSGVISVFADRIRQGRPLVIHGAGDQTRDFVHVDDVVRANLLAMAAATPEGVYNIGTGKETSVLGLARLLADICGTEPDIVHEPPRAGDIRRSCADIHRAAAIGYAPAVDIREGLARLIRRAR
ncbi:MAG: NAD-dependent epimerase/dehydratase family protein [Methanomicrobiales archaeon]